MGFRDICPKQQKTNRKKNGQQNGNYCVYMCIYIYTYACIYIYIHIGVTPWDVKCRVQGLGLNFDGQIDRLPPSSPKRGIMIGLSFRL